MFEQLRRIESWATLLLLAISLTGLVTGHTAVALVSIIACLVLVVLVRALPLLLKASEPPAELEIPELDAKLIGELQEQKEREGARAACDTLRRVRPELSIVQVVKVVQDL